MTLRSQVLWCVAAGSLSACQSGSSEPRDLDGDATQACEAESGCGSTAEDAASVVPEDDDSDTGDGPEPGPSEPDPTGSPNASNAPDTGPQPSNVPNAEPQPSDVPDAGPQPGNVPDAGGAVTSPAATDGAMVPYLGPGTRLKPTVVALGNGLDLLDPYTPTWFDSELGVRCLFGHAEDGQRRCIPMAAEIWFSDAECTAAGLIWRSAQLCAGPEPYVSDRNQTGTATCSGLLGYRVGEQGSRPAQLYRLLDSGCEPSEPNSLAGDFDLYYELERVPADTFVAVHLAPEPRVPGLDANTFRGEDGSYQVYGFYDSVRASVCRRESALQPVDRCVPPAASVTQYAGPDCTTGAADATLFESDPCALVDSPKLLIRYTLEASTDSCAVGSSGSYELFEMGEVQENSAQSYRLLDGVCTETPVEPVTKVLEGRPLDPLQLFSLETIELGSGDVHALFDGFAGEPYHFRGALLDARTGQPCTPVPFEGGARYCVPQSFEVQLSLPNPRYHLDENCTGQRVQPWSPPACPAEPSLPSGILNGRGDECTPWEVQETLSVVGEAPAGPAYNYVEETGACAPVDLSSARSLLLLGESLSAANVFVELEVVLRE